MTTKEDIQEWIEWGKKGDEDYMLVICDTFDYDDYPVFCKEKDYWETRNKYDNKNMQKIMESYNLNKNIQDQLNRRLCNETP